MTRETERTLRMIQRCGEHQQGDAVYLGTPQTTEAYTSDAPSLPLVHEETLFPGTHLSIRSDWGEAA